MKFNEYYIIEANKQEKLLIQKDPNFILGAELEFIVRKKDKLYDMDGVADLLSIFSPYKFNFDEDITIEEGDDIGIEIQTFPYDWDNFQKVIKNFFKFIQKYGYTNNSCSFHVTINYKNVKLPSDFGQKLAQSINDPKVYKDFPSRKDHQHAWSRTKAVMYGFSDDYYKRSYTFRQRRNNPEQVEFRAIGGKDYEYKWDIIKNIILDYMVNYYKSAFTHDFMKRKMSYSFSDSQIKAKLLKSKNINDIKKYMYQTNKRWLEAEPYIMKDPEYAFYYARDVIKGRWPEAEPYIMKDPEYAEEYKHAVIDQIK